MMGKLAVIRSKTMLGTSQAVELIRRKISRTTMAISKAAPQSKMKLTTGKNMGFTVKVSKMSRKQMLLQDKMGKVKMKKASLYT